VVTISFLDFKYQSALIDPDIYLRLNAWQSRNPGCQQWSATSDRAAVSSAAVEVRFEEGLEGV
jgi:hypothetical protein